MINPAENNALDTEMWGSEEEREQIMRMLSTVSERNKGTYDDSSYKTAEAHAEEEGHGLFTDIQYGVARGFHKAGESVMQLGYDALDALDNFVGLDLIDGDFKFDMADKYYKTETTAGDITAGITQFLTGFAITGGVGKALGIGAKVMPNIDKAVKALKLGSGASRYIGAATQGAITDAAFFDPYEQRASNLFETTLPALSNPVTRYLAADDGDTAAEGRLKNAIEGLAIGGATDFIFKTAKWLKSLRRAKDAGLTGKKLVSAHIGEFANAQEAVAKAAKEGTQPPVKVVQNGVLNEDAVREYVGGLSDDLHKLMTNPGDQKTIDHVVNTVETIRANAKAAGLDIDRPLNDLSDLIDNYISGKVSTSEAIDSVQNGMRSLNDILNIKPAKKVADKTATHTIGDIDTGEVIKKYVKGVTEGTDISTSKGIGHIRNNSESPLEGVQRVFSALENCETYIRDPKNITTETIESVRNKARNVLESWGKRGNYEKQVTDFLEQAGEAADGFSTMVAVTEGVIDDLAVQVSKYLEQFTGMADDAIVANISKDGMELLRAFAHASSRYDSIMTGVGRALNMSKYKHTMDLSSAINAAKGASADLNKGIQETILNSMSEGDILVALRRIASVDDNALRARMLIPDDTGKRFLAASNEYWLSCVLSSGQSQVNSAASGFFKITLINPAEKMLISGFRYLKNGRRWATEIDKELWYEGSKAWGGLMYSLQDAWRLAKVAYKYDQNLLKPNNTVIESRARTFQPRVTAESAQLSALDNMWNAFAATIRGPLSLLGAGDEFTSQLAYRQHLYGKLYAKADTLFEQGILKGKDKQAVIQDYIAQKFNQMLLDIHTSDGKTVKNSVGLLESGIREATDATYTATLPEGFAKSIQQVANNHPLFQRLIATFVRSTTNIMYDVGLHTPIVANNMRIYKDAMRSGGRQAAIVQGKMALGSFAWFTGVSLFLNGNITGGGGDKNRTANLDSGWRPYSFKFGDTYIRYDRIEPFGTVLGLIADTGEIFQELLAQDADDTAFDAFTTVLGQTGFACIRTLASKSFLKNMSDFVNATNSADMARSYVKNQALTYVPLSGGLNSMRRLIDPEVREARTMLDTLKNRLPVLSGTLPQSYSPLTGESMHYTGGRQTAINPYVVETVEPNEVAEELLKFKKSAFMPTDRIGGIKLTPEQKSFYFKTHGTAKINGRTLMEALSREIDSPAYDKNREKFPDSDQPNTGKRYEAISGIVMKYRDKAIGLTLKEFPELAEQVYGNTKQGNIHRNARRGMKPKGTTLGENAKAIANL